MRQLLFQSSTLMLFAEITPGTGPNEDNWLQLEQLKRPETQAHWETKIIRMSPEVAHELHGFLTQMFLKK